MIDGFHVAPFTALGETRDVYRRGSGPPVLLMHEMPGITPKVIDLARRIADDGFEVAMPHLFGEIGRPFSLAYNARELTLACVRREFLVLARHEASPITNWLRELARSLHVEGRGVGAIGLCITGNFALALMLEPCLMAPVLSQPSLPFAVGRSRRRALHVSPEALSVCKRRVRDEGARVLGLRFTHDALSPGERFERLRAELGDGFEAIEIDSGPGNAHRFTRLAHSVLAHDFVDADGHPTRAALDRVLSFLHERLDVTRP
jgi:dienelactone hydrolase